MTILNQINIFDTVFEFDEKYDHVNLLLKVVD